MIFSNYLKPVEVVVDRVSSDQVVLEFAKGKMFTFDKNVFSLAKEGDVLNIIFMSNNKKVVYTINKNKTKKRKEKIAKIIDKVFQ